jgi:hypothetical protein
MVDVVTGMIDDERAAGRSTRRFFASAAGDLGQCAPMAVANWTDGGRLRPDKCEVDVLHPSVVP